MAEGAACAPPRKPLPVLRLPFRYPLVRPGAAEDDEPVHVRAYTFARIEEIAASDAPPAIRVDDGSGREREYRVWGDHLFVPVLAPGTEVAVEPDAFEAMVSAGVSRAAPRLDPEDFPFEGIRMGSGSRSPLRCELAGTLKATAGLADLVEDEDGRARCEGRAQEFLAKAIVAIDGKMHLAAAEPVLAVVPLGPQMRVTVETHPSRVAAYDAFRLDRIAAARAWAEPVDGPVALSGTFEVLHERALARDDEWAIAAWIVDRCFRKRPPGGYPAATEGVAAACRRWRGEIPDGGGAEAVLEALSSAFAATGGHVTGFAGEDHSLARCLERWRAAQAEGRGVGMRDALSDEDAEALAAAVREAW